MLFSTLTPFSSSPSTSILPVLNKPFNLRAFYFTDRRTHLQKKKKKLKKGKCRAEFSTDAPFVIAIGTCMLSSLVLSPPTQEEDAADTALDSALDSTDTRFAAMGIISFIPYFNWLSWVFAWLDTGKRRYAVYSLVYLIPYMRSNLSLSPGKSWLPIASIIFCIVHVQLEASIRNGDTQRFQFFSLAKRHLSSMTENRDNHLEGHQEISEGRKRVDMKPPIGGEQSRNENRRWGVPGKTSKHEELLNEDSDDDKRRDL